METVLMCTGKIFFFTFFFSGCGFGSVSFCNTHIHSIQLCAILQQQNMHSNGKICTDFIKNVKGFVELTSANLRDFLLG